MKGFVVTVLAAGALVAFLMPDGEDAASRVKPVSPDASEAQLAVASGWGGEMALERERDGHFYADVEVGGSNYRMLVDTGATVVALTGEDARNMGLEWDPDALAPVARGASGVVMGVPITLSEVAVGDFVAHDVEAVIVPEGLGISLLGQSFLSHVENVAISGDKLTLSD